MSLNSNNQDCFSIEVPCNCEQPDKYFYTGASFTVPKNHIGVVKCSVDYKEAKPIGLIISSSNTNNAISTLEKQIESSNGNVNATYITNKYNIDKTYYVWGKFAFSGTSSARIIGKYFK